MLHENVIKLFNTNLTRNELKIYKKILENFIFCDCIDKNIFLWTYRFWEAVLCMSIPITNEPDLRLHKDYKYYSLEDEHVYNEEWANHNFNILKERHFIWIND